MSHRNARLNLHGRLLLVGRVISQQRPVSHVAKELGVSRECAHRWMNRYRAEGEAGLQDRSSRPHNCPHRTPARDRSSGRGRPPRPAPWADWLGPELGIPARTVSPILRRHQLPYLRECDPLTGAIIRTSKTTDVRYEHDHPGSLVHMDVKKVGRIHDGGGWKAHGRNHGQTSAQKRARIGFDYIHSMVDDHSRLASSEVLPDEQGITCAAFLERAATYFAGHGISRIERVMTDTTSATSVPAPSQS